MDALLAVDTSTEFCSVAVYFDGKFQVFHQSSPRQHAKLLLPTIDQLLSQAGINKNQLSGLVLGRGPGSFTGLRIAAGVIQGLGYGLNLPVYPVSTLTALAYQAKIAKSLAPRQIVLPALDARMEEVYWCPQRITEDGLVEPLQEEQVISPQQIAWKEGWQAATAVGNGWPMLMAQDPQWSSLTQASAEFVNDVPQAEVLIRWVLAAHPSPVVANQAVPVYLRDKVTWDQKPKVGS